VRVTRTVQFSETEAYVTVALNAHDW